MEARLLVDGIEHGSLVHALGRGKAGGETELESLGDLVIELDLGLEHVRVGPGVSEGEPMLLVGQLGLNVADDDGRLRGTVPGDLEDDTRWRLGLDFKRGAREGVVFLQQIRGGFSEILGEENVRKEATGFMDRGTFQDGGTG